MQFRRRLGASPVFRLDLDAVLFSQGVDCSLQARKTPLDRIAQVIPRSLFLRLAQMLSRNLNFGLGRHLVAMLRRTSAPACHPKRSSSEDPTPRKSRVDDDAAHLRVQPYSCQQSAAIGLK